MSGDDDKLKPLRERIDSIDQELLRLFNERAQAALEVGEVKLGSATDKTPVAHRWHCRVSKHD